MAFLLSFCVADDIWRFAWSLVGCLLALVLSRTAQ